MKKSLLAVAAMSAFAGSAQAQSSVTVYGILDVGYMSQSVKAQGQGPTAGGNTAGTGAYAATNISSANATSTAFGSSAEQTSRLGFKGTEDLGSGTTAFFTVETGLTPTNSANSSAWDNRQSFVGIGKKGLGSASIGTQYTPVHEAVAATDPGQANNMPGNLIYVSSLPGANNTNAFGNVTPAAQWCNNFLAANANGTAGAGAVGSCIGGPALASNPYTVRAGNMLKFTSDSFMGAVGKAFYTNNSNTTASASNNTTTNVGGATNQTGWGLGLDYTFQKLMASVDYQNFKANQTAGVTAASNGAIVTGAAVPQAGTTWGAAAITNVNQTDGYVGATYDFGILKAYAQYINRKVSATYDSNQYSKRTAQQIGVRSFVTPTIEAWASAANGKLTNSYSVQAIGAPMATQAIGQNLTAFQLGTNYWLSKRTNLYAIYGNSKVGNGVFPNTVAGDTSAINAQSSGVSAYALGVRHTF